ncbi:KH_1 domain-containing protein [Cephalotus follicularis]|uniref:KH_1 domain-containing protein n=1 Tax=Cephalotus follicularis TaxID=3775 RepID=A0A1Q3B6K9_CEPFO|nr:KH_1 domain-containing protein [Cephalotus follicularis]
MASSQPPIINSVAAESNGLGSVLTEQELEVEEDEPQEEAVAAAATKWPGWPGNNVFRLIVPVLKVGSIIGRKGELVKKLCDDTRARVRILEAPIGTPDRIVLISGKEEPDAQLPPAMDAALRVFKRVTGLSSTESDGVSMVPAVSAASAFCSVRLLVASSQAINLIGKQGSSIKAIQERTAASVRVLSEDEVPAYATSDEKIVEIHGEGMKVLKALEAVLGHLRKFLVDHTVLPVFEKAHNATISQDRPADTWADKTQSSLQSTPASQSGIGSQYSLSLKRDPLLYDPETRLDLKIPQQPGLSLYGKDTGLGGLRSTGHGRTATPIVTQMSQTMQVPISYAEDIIGVGGSNIAYIRSSSGAVLTVQEIRGLPDEISIEIKGTTAQVQMAQQLIQECTSDHKETASSVYGKMDTGLGTYSQLADASYPSSSFASHLGGYGSSSVGRYGSSSAGGYNSYRF